MALFSASAFGDLVLVANFIAVIMIDQSVAVILIDQSYYFLSSPPITLFYGKNLCFPTIMNNISGYGQIHSLRVNFRLFANTFHL
jgi:hypothetical protein